MAKKVIKKDPVETKCMTCANADLMQWGKDPIIAQCNPRKQREVANAPRSCQTYEQAKVLPKPIKQMGPLTPFASKNN